uniref:Uncharacterized protein n=4 Tax=Aegilops tauschii subsp. strangulata TaxID=200361 RepID=A0A453P123_AEGTS
RALRSQSWSRGCCARAHTRTNPSRHTSPSSLTRQRRTPSLLAALPDSRRPPHPFSPFLLPAGADERDHALLRSFLPPVARSRALVTRKPREEELNRASLAGEGGESRMPAKEADRLASVINTASAPPPFSAREEASGGGESSSRGSRGRRSSTGRRRTEKEERRGCLPGRRIGSSPRLERARCYNYNMGLQVSITMEHQYPCILVTTKCHTNECECLFR